MYTRENGEGRFRGYVLPFSMCTCILHVNVKNNYVWTFRGRPGLICTDECRQAKWNRRTLKSTSPAATFIRRKYRQRRLFHFPLSSNARRLLLCKVGGAAAAVVPTDRLDIKLDAIAKADL